MHTYTRHRLWRIRVESDKTYIHTIHICIHTRRITVKKSNETYIHTHTYIHTRAYTHTYIHTFIHTCIHIRRITVKSNETYIHTHTYIHTRTYTHTYIHTYIHTYLYIHAESPSNRMRHVYSRSSPTDIGFAFTSTEHLFKNAAKRHTFINSRLTDFRFGFKLQASGIGLFYLRVDVKAPVTGSITKWLPNSTLRHDRLRSHNTCWATQLESQEISPRIRRVDTLK